MIHASTDPCASFFKPGHNCWRVEQTHRAAYLIDGAAYFRAFRDAALRAQHSIMILGWDFDSQIPLLGPNEHDGLPSRLGEFLTALLRRRRSLHIYILTWDFHMVFALEREWWPLSRIGAHRRLHFRRDSSHPVWASHHQKVVVIDDQVAFVGGLDLAQCRWDTPQHEPHHPLRVFPDGRPCRPFHDTQMLMDGVAASALGELCRARWHHASGRRIRAASRTAHPAPWPPHVKADLEGCPVAIARTAPRYNGQAGVREVEQLYLDAIQHGRRSIYIETQYLTSHTLGAAIKSRLMAPDGPEILILLHPNSDGWLEQHTMDVLRGRLLKELRAADQHGHLGLYYPYVPGWATSCMSVHSKVCIVDDVFAKVGSSNMSNRSMGFDTECDVAVEAGEDIRTRKAIAAFRNRLLGEHLDVSPDTIGELLNQGHSLLRVVEALRGNRRTLHVFDSQIPADVDAWIPDSQLIDPDCPFDADRLVEEVVPDEERHPARRHLIGSLVVLSALIALAGAWRWTPLGQWLDVPSLLRYIEAVQETGLAPVLTIGAFVLGGLLIVPITMLIAVTLLAFGPLRGFTYSFVGMTLSAVVLFGLGHLLGRQTVQKLSGSRLQAISRRLAQRGVLAIIAVRIIPVAPFSIINLVAGASHISLRDFFIGTVIGELPGLLAVSIFVDQMAAAIADPGLGTFVFLALVAGLLLLGAWGLRQWLKRKAPEAIEEPGSKG